jgi:hypothetical protein
MVEMQWVLVAEVVKILDTNLHVHCNEMLCQHATLSGYAEWPKVADAIIEAGNEGDLIDGPNSFHIHPMLLTHAGLILPLPCMVARYSDVHGYGRLHSPNS